MKYEQLKNQYDSLYASAENIFGGGKPIEVVPRLKEYLPTGSVLDIGGGEGRNALYLAEQGFAVSVVDISAVGIERLQAAAAAKGLSIDTQVADVVDEGIARTYDAYILSFVLHHMSTEDAKRVIAAAQEHTAAGGVHILSTFSNQGGLYERNRTTGRFYPSEKTIAELYSNWDIKELSVTEVTTHARSKDGQRMRNRVITLVAVKGAP